MNDLDASVLDAEYVAREISWGLNGGVTYSSAFVIALKRKDVQARLLRVPFNVTGLVNLERVAKDAGLRPVTHQLTAGFLRVLVRWARI